MLVTVKDWLAPSVVRWPDPDAGPWQVVLRWREDGGRAVCTGASLELLENAPTSTLTTSVWRAVPVAGLIAQARETRREESGGPPDAHDLGGLDVSEGLIEEWRDASEPWRRHRGPGRPVTLDEQHYLAVAETYSKAHANGARPRDAVRRRWTVSLPTASRWIAEARARGLLPTTERGRARGNVDLAVSSNEDNETGE